MEFSNITFVLEFLIFTLFFLLLFLSFQVDLGDGERKERHESGS